MARWVIKIKHKSYGDKEFDRYDAKSAEIMKKIAIDIYGKESVEVYIDGILVNIDLKLY